MFDPLPCGSNFDNCWFKNLRCGREKYRSGRLAVELPDAYPDSASRSEEWEYLRGAIAAVPCFSSKKCPAECVAIVREKRHLKQRHWARCECSSTLLRCRRVDGR